MSVHVDACLYLSNNINAVFSFVCMSSEDQSTVDHSACMNVVEQAPSRRFLGSLPGGSDGVGAHRWQSPGTLPHRLNIPMSAFQQLHVQVHFQNSCPIHVPIVWVSTTCVALH